MEPLTVRQQEIDLLGRMMVRNFAFLTMMMNEFINGKILENSPEKKIKLQWGLY